MDDCKEWLKLQYCESVRGHQGHYAQELKAAVATFTR